MGISLLLSPDFAVFKINGLRAIRRIRAAFELVHNSSGVCDSLVQFVLITIIRQFYAISEPEFQYDASTAISRSILIDVCLTHRKPLILLRSADRLLEVLAQNQLPCVINL